MDTPELFRGIPHISWSPPLFSLLAPLVGLRVQLVVPGKAAIRLYLLDPFNRTDCIFIRSKGSETEISLAAWPES